MSDLSGAGTLSEIGSDQHRNGSLIYQRRPFSSEQLDHIQRHHDDNNAPKLVFDHKDPAETESNQLVHTITTDRDTAPCKMASFVHRINSEFEPLRQHLLKGNDVIIPHRDRSRFVDDDGGQYVFHGLGSSTSDDEESGSPLPIHCLQYIQCKIDELADIAEGVLTVDCYGYHGGPDPVAGGSTLEIDLNVTPHAIVVTAADVVSTAKGNDGCQTMKEDGDRTDGGRPAMDRQVFSQMIRQKGLIKRQRSEIEDLKDDVEALERLKREHMELQEMWREQSEVILSQKSEIEAIKMDKQRFAVSMGSEMNRLRDQLKHIGHGQKRRSRDMLSTDGCTQERPRRERQRRGSFMDLVGAPLLRFNDE